MKFCSQCGQGNKDDATFCIQCGASLEPERTPGAVAAPPAGAVSPPPSGEVAPPEPGVVPPGAIPPPPGVPGLQAPGAPPGVPYGAVPARPMGRQQPTEGMAVASLVLSIASFIVCPVVPAILGLIFGYLSLTKIEESRGTLGGSELARAGIIISWINIGITVLVGMFILVVAIVASTQ